jgi:hypothetical protein
MILFEIVKYNMTKQFNFLHPLNHRSCLDEPITMLWRRIVENRHSSMIEIISGGISYADKRTSCSLKSKEGLAAN